MGLISKVPVINVWFDGKDVIVFVKQSDSTADVSIQRESSLFDPTTSSQSSRVSQVSCFRADKVNRQAFVVDLLGIGRNQCAKRLSQSTNQTPLLQKLFPPTDEK